MQFLQVSRNDMVTYGIDFPTTFSLTPLTTAFNNKPSLLSTITGLLTFGGGKSLMGIGIVNPSLVAQMSHSSGKLLLQTQVRGLSSQKAVFHAGERYPILTGSYSAGQLPSQQFNNAPAPSFSFEDLGLTLTVTPFVHGLDDVSLDIDAQFKVLTGRSLNGLPIISARSVKDVTRLKFGEWALIAGLMQIQEARLVSGLAGLATIPYLGPLFSVHTRDDTTDQLLVLLRPVLLSPPPNAGTRRSFRTGTDTRPLTPL